MAAANVLEPLRWKRAKTHRGSRHDICRIRKPDIRQQLWPLILYMPNTVAIGRGPYTSTHGTSATWRGTKAKAALRPQLPPKRIYRRDALTASHDSHRKCRPIDMPIEILINSND